MRTQRESSVSSTQLSPQLLDINLVFLCVAVCWKQRTLWAQLFSSEPFLCYGNKQGRWVRWQRSINLSCKLWTWIMLHSQSRVRLKSLNLKTCFSLQPLEGLISAAFKSGSAKERLLGRNVFFYQQTRVILKTRQNFKCYSESEGHCVFVCRKKSPVNEQRYNDTDVRISVTFRFQKR